MKLVITDDMGNELDLNIEKMMDQTGLMVEGYKPTFKEEQDATVVDWVFNFTGPCDSCGQFILLDKGVVHEAPDGLWCTKCEEDYQDNR